MAKSTGLQIVNKVLKNLGESTVSDLLSLAGISLMVFDTVNELLYDLATEYKYAPLEEDGTITLSTGIASTPLPSDMYDFDKDSFRYDNSKYIDYMTPQRFDREYITQTNSGTPDAITKWKDVWKPYPIPASGANGKAINYRYWKIPTIFATATPTGTCWMPEGFDLTLLADYVTFKVLHYKHNEEALTYYTKVWGDGKLNEGSLARFKAIYGSPQLLDENIFSEPL